MVPGSPHELETRLGGRLAVRSWRFTRMSQPPTLTGQFQSYAKLRKATQSYAKLRKATQSYAKLSPYHLTVNVFGGVAGPNHSTPD